MIKAKYKDLDVFIHYTNSRMTWCLISSSEECTLSLKVDTSDLTGYTQAALELLRDEVSFNLDN